MLSKALAKLLILLYLFFLLYTLEEAELFFFVKKGEQILRFLWKNVKMLKACDNLARFLLLLVGSYAPVIFSLQNLNIAIKFTSS
jgi:hypothetical protein